VLIVGKVTNPHIYEDGTASVEITFPLDYSEQLPLIRNQRVSINLIVGDQTYIAGLRHTDNNRYIWISPDCNERTVRLSDVISSAGYKKNDKIEIDFEGKNARVILPVDKNCYPRLKEEVDDKATCSEETGKEFLNLSPFKIGSSYTRDDLAILGGVTPQKNTREWGGLKDFQNCAVIFVTLDKTDRKASIQYTDFFEDDGETFFWQSQSTSTQNAPRIQRIINRDPVVLFARIKDKIKSVTQPFIYVGHLTAEDYENNKPVDFRFNVDDFQIKRNYDLNELYQWKTEKDRAPRHIEVSSKRKASQAQKTDKAIAKGGQGRLADPKKKKEIELHAMALAKQHYENLGFIVLDTSSNNPYDLECQNGNEIRRIEVKGTTQGPNTISITRGELEAARAPEWQSDLFIVHDIEVTKSDDSYNTEGGKTLLITNWYPEDQHLTPTDYRYQVPIKAQ